jgi:hypothetical protein
MWRESHRQRASHSGGRTFTQVESETQVKIRPGGGIIEDIRDDMLMGSKEAVRQSWRLLCLLRRAFLPFG